MGAKDQLLSHCSINLTPMPGRLRKTTSSEKTKSCGSWTPGTCGGWPPGREGAHATPQPEKKKRKRKRNRKTKREREIEEHLFCVSFEPSGQ